MKTNINPHGLSEATLQLLKEYGFTSLREYLSEQYTVPYSIVTRRSELFDGLISAVQDAESEFEDEYDLKEDEEWKQ